MSAALTQGLLTAFTTYAQPELRAADGAVVAVLPVGEEADARRLAACWNSFDGCDTALIELVPKLGASTLPYRLMKVSHAELLAVAIRAKAWIADTMVEELLVPRDRVDNPPIGSHLHALTEAIANAEALAAEYARVSK